MTATSSEKSTVTGGITCDSISGECHILCITCIMALQGAASPFRDNDGLAALLAVELQADLLVLLTDVDGLYTGPPTAESSL